MAFVKISAHYLAHVGPVEAEKHLYALLSQLGEVKESANVSRIDLFALFRGERRRWRLAEDMENRKRTGRRAPAALPTLGAYRQIRKASIPRRANCFSRFWQN